MEITTLDRQTQLDCVQGAITEFQCHVCSIHVGRVVESHAGLESRTTLIPQCSYSYYYMNFGYLWAIAPCQWLSSFTSSVRWATTSIPNLWETDLMIVEQLAQGHSLMSITLKSECKSVDLTSQLKHFKASSGYFAAFNSITYNVLRYWQLASFWKHS